MDTSGYNDYVLSACLEARWINEDQKQMIETALSRIPGGAALDLMAEQEILSSEQVQMLAGYIEAAQQPPVESTADDESHGSSISINEEDDGGAHVHDLLRRAVELEASDIHLSPFSPPLIRRFGHLIPMNHGAPELSPRETERFAKQFLTQEQIEQVEEIGSIDFCYDSGVVGRFRTSVVRQLRGWESVFRIIPTKIRTMEQLGLPEVLYEMIRYHNGLVLVTGPVGSGKTTTLAAMIHQINSERKDHIITLEDPIEYVFHASRCQVTQREIRKHTESFATALRGALRQDPDVIMVGEMRDLETISLAITASETGHLVLATLHTSTAARTMQRLLDVFPVEQQAQIRTMVSESIRGIVCQQLVPRVDGQSRVLAMEIMVNSAAIAALIRDNKTHMIPSQMQIGRKLGMQLMDDALINLFGEGLITQDEAYRRADNKNLVAAAIAAMGRK